MRKIKVSWNLITTAYKLSAVGNILYLNKIKKPQALQVGNYQNILHPKKLYSHINSINMHIDTLALFITTIKFI